MKKQLEELKKVSENALENANAKKLAKEYKKKIKELSDTLESNNNELKYI